MTFNHARRLTSIWNQRDYPGEKSVPSSSEKRSIGYSDTVALEKEKGEL